MDLVGAVRTISFLECMSDFQVYLASSKKGLHLKITHRVSQNKRDSVLSFVRIT